MSARHKKPALLRAELLEEGLSSFAANHGSSGVELEIGCGDGTFLPWLAEQSADCQIVGIEKEYEWACKAARKIRNEANASVLCYDAGWLLRQLVGRGDARGVWMNFPDPWPKLRHAQRRLAGTQFFVRLASIVAQDGLYHLATDVEDYADLVRALLKDSPNWELLAHSPRADAPVQTRFEKKWLGMSRTCYYLSARLVKPIATEPLALAGSDLLAGLETASRVLRPHGTQIRSDRLVARFLGPFKNGRAQVAVARTDEPGHLLAKLQPAEQAQGWHWINRHEWIATEAELRLLRALVSEGQNSRN